MREHFSVLPVDASKTNMFMRRDATVHGHAQRLHVAFFKSWTQKLRSCGVYESLSEAAPGAGDVSVPLEMQITLINT
jgi:hypothetical protein